MSADLWNIYSLLNLAYQSFFTFCCQWKQNVISSCLSLKIVNGSLAQWITMKPSPSIWSKTMLFIAINEHSLASGSDIWFNRNALRCKLVAVFPKYFVLLEKCPWSRLPVSQKTYSMWSKIIHPGKCVKNCFWLCCFSLLLFYFFCYAI